jgi:hypothetical protein
VTKRRALALIATALSVALVGAGLNAQAGKNSRPSGGRAIAHRDGKAVSARFAPTAQTFSVGGRALEPTLGLDDEGQIYYAAAGFNQVGLAGTTVLRSDNGGANWKVTSPRVLGQDAHPVSLDPYIWVDDLPGKKERIFTIDLTVACSYMSFSDDGGATWTTNPLACGRPVNDHQTLFSGPPATSPDAVYPHVLYYCWNDVASSACSKSIDGGISWTPTGTPAYEGYEEGSQDPGFYDQSGLCGGLHGHGAVGPDGTVYLPREFCGKPMLAISKDEGLTWERVVVSNIRSISQPKEGAGHPSVTTDAKGNIYYTWIAAQNRLPFMSVSKNGGKSWSKPVMIGAPGLKETNLPQIDARGVGKVAIVYYGSSNSPFSKCGLECEATDYKKTTWNGYMTISANALDKKPTFYSGVVNDPSDPLVRTRCGPGRCQQVFDFIDVEIGRDGIPYGAFVDSCIPSPSPGVAGCTEMTPGEGDYEGLMMKLVGGPSLR